MTYPRYYPFTSGVCYPWNNLFGTVGNTVGISILYVHVLCCVVCVITGTACYKTVLIFRGLLLPLLPHCTKVAVLHFATNNASLWAGGRAV